MSTTKPKLDDRPPPMPPGRERKWQQCEKCGRWLSIMEWDTDTHCYDCEEDDQDG